MQSIVCLFGAHALIMHCNLERVHRRAAKLIHDILTSTPVDQILDQAKWKDIKYLYKKRVACLTHRAYYREAPEEIKSLIKE